MIMKRNTTIVKQNTTVCGDKARTVVEAWTQMLRLYHNCNQEGLHQAWEPSVDVALGIPSLSASSSLSSGVLRRALGAEEGFG